MLLSSFGGCCLLASSPAVAIANTTPPVAYGQASPAPTPASLRIDSLVATPRTVTAADLAALPHREQATTDIDGRKHLYRRVALAVFALPEIDADFAPQTILLADQRDGQPLPPLRALPTHCASREKTHPLGASAHGPARGESAVMH